MTTMKSKKILILDDDNDILEILTLLLTESGYEIRTSNHGRNIFEEIRDFKPGLVLMDIMLAGMDGRTICRDIKVNPLTNLLRVILISGSHDLSRSLDLPGAPDDFLAKPFDIDELYTKIAKQLAA
jgi:DNA-binding response OmpR family regulator